MNTAIPSKKMVRKDLIGRATLLTNKVKYKPVNIPWKKNIL